MLTKEQEARELAREIITSQDSYVRSVDDWSAEDVYEWVEAWGFEWRKGYGWVSTEQDE